MFENHGKSLIQHCELSELSLHFEWTKVNLKMPKNGPFWRVFEPEACGQTVLPGRSVLSGQKLVEKPKLKCDILSNFQTMWKSNGIRYPDKCATICKQTSRILCSLTFSFRKNAQ